MFDLGTCFQGQKWDQHHISSLFSRSNSELSSLITPYPLGFSSLGPGELCLTLGHVLKVKRGTNAILVPYFQGQIRDCHLWITPTSRFQNRSAVETMFDLGTCFQGQKWDQCHLSSLFSSSNSELPSLITPIQ